MKRVPVLQYTVYQVSKGGPDDQNFTDTTPVPARRNLRKSATTNRFSLNGRNERLGLDRSADTFSCAVFDVNAELFLTHRRQ